MKYAAVVFFSVWLVACSQPDEHQALVHVSGHTMGTEYRATWPATQFSDATTLQRRLADRLLEINAAMSTYDPNSELSRINQMSIDRLRQGVTVSQDLATVLRMSQVLHHQSGGVFDVTIGPLVNAWGFGPDAFSGKSPSSETIAAALTQVGGDAIQLEGLQLTLQHPLYIDLSAIAKGWAVNELADIIHQHGIEQFLVEIGGELYAKGVKPDGEPWRIAIERPSQGSERQAQLVLPLTDLGIATSGNYRNYFIQDGIQYSHTLDPRTGYPVRHDLTSVTVIHESVGLADAWATALIVVGTEDALALAETHELAVFMLQRQPDGYVELTSSRFRQLFADAL